MISPTQIKNIFSKNCIIFINLFKNVRTENIVYTLKIKHLNIWLANLKVRLLGIGQSSYEHIFNSTVQLWYCIKIKNNWVISCHYSDDTWSIKQLIYKQIYDKQGVTMIKGILKCYKHKRPHYILGWKFKSRSSKRLVRCHWIPKRLFFFWRKKEG